MKNCYESGKKLLIGVGALIVLGIIKSIAKGGKTTTKTTTKTATQLTSATSFIAPTPSAVVPTTEVVSTNINIELLEVTTQDDTVRDSVKAHPQGSWKVVKLSIQNDQKDAINVNSLNFKLDKDTHEFTISTAGTIGLEMTENKTLSLQTSKPSNIAEGSLTYDVPKGITEFTLEDSGSIAGTPVILKMN